MKELRAQYHEKESELVRIEQDEPQDPILWDVDQDVVEDIIFYPYMNCLSSYAQGLVPTDKNE